MTQTTQLAGRIRAYSADIDALIRQISSLAADIDAAASRGEIRLAQQYQEAFDNIAVKFMTNVEAILDDYYMLKGKKRSRLTNEKIEDMELATMHSDIVDIIKAQPAREALIGDVPLRTPEPVLGITQDEQEIIIPPKVQKGPAHKIDLKG